eukprot:988853-Pleurochrysis_carterae.AAC.1
MSLMYKSYLDIAMQLAHFVRAHLPIRLGSSSAKPSQERGQTLYDYGLRFLDGTELRGKPQYSTITLPLSTADLPPICSEWSRQPRILIRWVYGANAEAVSYEYNNRPDRILPERIDTL